MDRSYGKVRLLRRSDMSVHSFLCALSPAELINELRKGAAVDARDYKQNPFDNEAEGILLLDFEFTVEESKEGRVRIRRE